MREQASGSDNLPADAHGDKVSPAHVVRVAPHARREGRLVEATFRLPHRPAKGPDALQDIRIGRHFVNNDDVGGRLFILARSCLHLLEAEPHVEALSSERRLCRLGYQDLDQDHWHYHWMDT